MKQKTRILIYILIAAAAVIIGVIAVFSKAGGGESALGHIDLGRTYLIELSYDKAVIEFTEAIRIDPMNVDAYLGLAEAYEKMGDMDKAIEWLEKGFEMTGDERVRKMLDELLAKAASSEMAVIYVPEDYQFNEGINYRTFSSYCYEKDKDDDYYVEVMGSSVYNGWSFTKRLKNKGRFEMFNILRDYYQDGSFGQEYKIHYPVFDYDIEWYNYYDFIPKISIYDANGGVIQRAENEYDSENRLLKSVCYDSTGEMLSMTEYTYNEIGKIAVISERSEESGSRIEFEYDDSNNCIKRTEYYNDTGFNCSDEYKYDNNNRCIEIVHTKSNGYISNRQYKYDDDGNAVEMTMNSPDYYRKCIFDEDGYKKECVDDGYNYSHYFYEYDKNGNIISDKCYSESKTDDDISLVLRKYIYENDKLISEIYLSTDGQGYENAEYECYYDNGWVYANKEDFADKYTYVYDQYGRLIERTTEDNFAVFTHRINSYTYDEKGNKVKETDTFYFADGSIYTANVNIYTYDEQGKITNCEHTGYYSSAEYTEKSNAILTYDEHSNISKIERNYTDSDGETSTESYDIKYLKIEIPKIFIEQIKSDYGIDITE